MKKKKVSSFEFAITEICDPETAKNVEPFTESEELEIRREKIRAQLERIKVIKN